MSEFHTFAAAVNKRLTEMSGGELFRVEITDIFATYLSAFPPGTNEIFRTRTEHDCSCCKNFLRNMGSLVAIVDGRRQSIWDIDGLPEPYATVASALRDIISQAPIAGVYRTKEGGYGAESTYEQMEIYGPHGLGHYTKTWNHFYGTVASRHRSAEPDTVRGNLNTTAEVLKRGLDELRPEALDTVIDLIESNSLYRGAEFLQSVQEFKALQQTYRNADQPELVVWSSLGARCARLSNTVIGELLKDLSSGVDVDRAVRTFETRVAPANYKRPTALITPRMIDDALKTLADLGLEHAVERRFARIADVSINDVLWVDNSVRDQMKGGGLRAALLGAVTSKAPDTKDATPIDMDAFVRVVLPTATSLDVLVRNSHRGNFVSLVAPVYPDTGKLLKWHNDFTWSYRGEVADSIKQRVKAAGGNIEADLRVSLSWLNFDDLDLHSDGPHGNVSFRNKGIMPGGRTILDVDMNAGGGNTREAVENQSWIKPKDGVYTVWVNQYNKRESDNTGFTLEIECNGILTQYSHSGDMPSGRTVECVSFKMTSGVMSDLKVLSKSLIGGAQSVTEWGVKTETFVPAATMMFSPNHWEGAGGFGQKHLFFMLKDCKNPDAVRGLYNEFLRGVLDHHRKVFRGAGRQDQVPPTDDQLSGLGFSAGRGDAVTVKVTSPNATRLYSINF